ncbi:hypothetical protein SAMN04487895_104264 [Paenibacillus sophorae]|uniref:Uncharacterized protein n=1 Tax=Paenibacillus sophorae TaxID=1333845 RepID=A0A1H8LB35_9BACL|nr:hypothetical protein [Paenibacillus sophorae]QWU17352.1 hypothetical protein KP014_09470 [Paenibacillus sophorae]SEO02382.1 hypothetical protein SAMN04487895_104264 [Paenibacillus sophorae]
MNGDELGGRVWKSMIGEHIWALMESDQEAFKTAVKEYFARGHPDFTVIRAKYPHIYIRDDRGQQA